MYSWRKLYNNDNGKYICMYNKLKLESDRIQVVIKSDMEDNLKGTKLEIDSRKSF